MTSYKIEYRTNYWECGDGCCEGSETRVTVNSMVVGHYGDFHKYDVLDRFIEVLNGSEEELLLRFQVDVEEDGKIRDAVYLNETKITNSFHCCEVYSDILDTLKLPYIYRTYDYDWDLWQKEKKLVLLLDEEEMVTWPS